MLGTSAEVSLVPEADIAVPPPNMTTLAPLLRGIAKGLSS